MKTRLTRRIWGDSMAIYTIGDLHLSLGSDKPMDIFEGWGNYTKRLEKNWRNIVRDGDTVVIVGDISWAMTLDEAQTDFSFIESLPGSKIITKGNHDYWWTTMKKMSAWLDICGFGSIRFLFNNAYVVEDTGICGTRSWFYDEDEYENDKVFAREIGRLDASIAALNGQLCEEKIAFLHYPPVYRGSVVGDILKILKENDIHRCFYGHLHGASIDHAFNGMLDGIEFRLVSADNLDFAPFKVK